jgi:hypothetical protein
VTEQARASALDRIGRRGAALLFFTLLDFVYCLSLLTSPRPLSPLYAWMDTVLPLTVWAVCWGSVGVACLYFAFCAYDTPAFMAAVALKVAWGLNALLGWIDGAVPLGYVSTVIWLAFAAFVYLIAGGIPAASPKPARWRPWRP